MLYHHPHLSKERASQLSLLNGGIESLSPGSWLRLGQECFIGWEAPGREGKAGSHWALLPLGMSKESLVLLLIHPAKCVSARLRAEAFNSGNKALPPSMGLLPNLCTRLILGD